jgi:ribosomal subunit interface protein
MDLHVNGRGTRITDRLRTVAEHKLSSLERLEPRLARLEIVVSTVPNSRLTVMHRVEAVARTPRKTFRAHADAHEPEAALDMVVDKLERQIRDHHKKRRAKLLAGAGRVKSAQTAQERPGPSAGERASEE